MTTKKTHAPILMIGHPGEVTNIRYATGFSALDPVVALCSAKSKHLVVPALELGRAQQEASDTTIHTPASLGLSALDRRSLSQWIKALLKTCACKKVRVSHIFPLGMAKELAKANITIEVIAGELFPGRAVKSDREIRCIRQAQKAAVQAMNEAVQFIASSRRDQKGFLRRGKGFVRSEDVRHVIEVALLNQGCFAKETIVAGGRQGADPHDRGHGRLKANESIVLDIFPQHRTTGYWGDITRTIVKGKATDEIRNMFEAVRAAHKAALLKTKAGIQSRSVHQAAANTLKQFGYETAITESSAEGFIHSTGHGVGLDIHEAPSVSTAPGKLKAGHVITIEPGLYYKQIGGVRIEDTVAVTTNGHRMLARCPVDLEV